MTDNRTVEIKAALDRVADVLGRRPDHGKRTFRSVAVAGRGTTCVVEEAGETLTLDVGKALGGTHAGPSPSMVLRAALGGCIVIGIKQWAAWRGVPIDGVQVHVETDVDARGQLGLEDRARPGFEAVRLSILAASPADPIIVEDLIVTTLKYSPLMDVFIGNQPIEYSIHVAQHAQI